MNAPPTCESFRSTLPDLATGELTAAARAATLAHLEGCTACSAEYRALAMAWQAVQALPEAEPAAWVDQAILEAVRVRAQAARIAPPRWGTLGSAAIGALAAALLAMPVTPLVPFDWLAAHCERLLLDPRLSATWPALPFLLAGLLYGALAHLAVIPFLVQRAGPPRPGQAAIGAVLFALLLLPVAWATCDPFTAGVAGGLLTGLAAGALSGTLGGAWLVARAAR